MNTKTRKLTLIAMFCAIAYVVMVVARIPVVLFLKYEPKDVIITIGGFLMGPLASAAISVVVSFVEMFTVSDTGIIGFVMNVLSSCSFACTAAVIYKKKHTLKGAVIGLISGCAVMVGVMLLWNYFITPLYMGYPREAVAELLLPAFLPFNLLKAASTPGSPSCFTSRWQRRCGKPIWPRNPWEAGNRAAKRDVWAFYWWLWCCLLPVCCWCW